MVVLQLTVGRRWIGLGLALVVALLAYIAWAEWHRYDAGDLLRDMGAAAVEAEKEREQEAIRWQRTKMSMRRTIEELAKQELQKEAER